jgi:hypothetical protein
MSQESRLNYGIFFRPVGRLTTGTENWKHTFKLSIPRQVYPRLNTINCLDERQANCFIHNLITHTFNRENDKLQDVIKETIKTAKKILNTNFDIDKILQDGKRDFKNNKRSKTKRDTGLLFPVSYEMSFPYMQDAMISQSTGTLANQLSDDLVTLSRSTRGLFDFVGDLASGLFGVATQDEVNALKQHINTIYQREQESVHTNEKEYELMHSFMNKTNEDLHNIYEAMQENHRIVTEVSKVFTQNIKDLRQLQVDVNRLIIKLIEKSANGVRFEQNLQSFLNGMHDLVQRRLSPQLVPEHKLRQTLIDVQRKLRRKYLDFQVVNRHPAFYYQAQDVLYSSHDDSFLVTINIPISSKSALFQVYQVITLPVPLNHTTTHATQLTNIPDYIAISDDRSAYFEMTNADFSLCTGRPIMSCPLTQGQRSVQRPTCAVALFLQDNPHDYCEFRMKETAVKPNAVEVQSGLVLLSNVTEVILTCRREVIKKPGCMYCVYTIPCECSLVADEFQIPARLTACTDLQDIETQVVYPVNIAILQQFFNSSDIKHILADSLFSEPITYTIPNLEIAEKAFQKDLEQGSKLDADLKTITAKMKNSEKVYRQLSSYAFDDQWLNEPDLTQWPTILGLIAFVLGVITTVIIFIIYRRVRALWLIVGMLTSGQPVNANPVVFSSPLTPSSINNAMSVTSTTNPPLIFMPPTKTSEAVFQPPCEPPLADQFVLTIELISLLLLLIFIIRSAGLLIKTAIYRTEAILEVTDGKNVLDIYLATLPQCPSEYFMVMRAWVRSIHLIENSWIANDLEIVWPSFYLTSIITNESLQLPHTIKLTYYQSYRLKKVIEQGDYAVNLKLVHGGRASYLKRVSKDEYARQVGNPTCHRNDYSTLGGEQNLRKQAIQPRKVNKVVDLEAVE